MLPWAMSHSKFPARSACLVPNAKNVDIINITRQVLNGTFLFDDGAGQYLIYP